MAKGGDLVFFSNTYDRNRDGRMNDLFTHVGIVDRVEPDGTVVFLHYMKGKVRRYAMNRLKSDRVEDEEGKIVNSYLRRKRRRDPRDTSYLAAGMFETYGSLVLEPGATPPKSDPTPPAPSSTPPPEPAQAETM